MISWAEKYLALKGILGREVSAQEMFLGKVLSLAKVLFLGGVSCADKSLPMKVLFKGKGSFPGKGSLRCKGFLGRVV